MYGKIYINKLFLQLSNSVKQCQTVSNSVKQVTENIRIIKLF